tara:strand:+ start:1463 stop:1711 length:249 start_codon:yes stop_codon:yes gene_type:complete
MAYNPNKDGTVYEYFENKKKMWRDWMVNYMATPEPTEEERYEEMYRDLDLLDFFHAHKELILEGDSKFPVAKIRQWRRTNGK